MTVDEILKFNPVHVLEFGTGSGKNLRLIQQKRPKVSVSGLDISLLNVLQATVKNNLPHVVLGDETHLRHYCNFDVVFTTSVLDHIENVSGIIHELQRIANKAVVIAECLDHEPEIYYYKHDYESFGFELVAGSEHLSDGDGRMYYIYQWIKGSATTDKGPNDDKA
jgi:trans-aconitate methyltransferase